MKINREWSMPSAWTFTIKPIKKLLDEEITKGLWCDPFAGKNSPAQITNDINPERDTTYHMDALDFLKQQPSGHYDGVLLDPPYSNRQISEHYKSAGMKVTGWHTSAGWGKSIRDEVARITKVGGKVISFGWNSGGIGKTRGFEISRILLVPHGGSKNDTIVTVDIKHGNNKPR